MKPDKILMLDIDGVLCLPTQMKERDEHGWNFAPECVANLKRIVDETNACIVISSTWRLYEDMFKLWKDRCLPGKVIGVTPHILEKIDGSQFVRSCRGKDIESWIAQNDFKGKYCIIDDDVDMLEYQKPFFVRTGMMYGLTGPLAMQAIAILNA